LPPYEQCDALFWKQYKLFTRYKNIVLNKKKGEKDITGSVDKMNDKFSGDGASAVNKFGASLTTMAGGAAVALTAITGLTVGIGKFAMAQVGLARELGRVADNANIARDAVSGIATTFIEAGGDVDMASDFIQDFTERLGDARSGSLSLQEAFTSLGVDMSGSTEDALRQTIDTLGSMEDRQTALFRGIELFGDTYKTVAQDISDGSDIMADGMFGDQFIRNSERLQRNIGDIKVEFQTAANEGIEPMIDSMANLTEWFLESGAIDSFTDYLQDVGTVASWVAEQFEKFADSKTPVGELTKAVEDMTATIEFAESMLAKAENRLDNQENIEHWRFMVKVHKEDLGILQQELDTLKEIQDASSPERIAGRTPSITPAGGGGADPSDGFGKFSQFGMSVSEYWQGQIGDSQEQAELEYIEALREHEAEQIRIYEEKYSAQQELLEQELILIQQTEEAKKQLIFDGAQFAFDIGNTFFAMFSIKRSTRA
jgi:hypothetical protein